MDKHQRHRAKNRKAGLCTICGKPAATTQLCADCHESERLRAREKTKRLKAEIFDHYGRVCVCCKQEFVDPFLTLNHVLGDGAKHRKEVGGGRKMYLWARRNGYPRTLETNCWNCNSARLANDGVCPHAEL